MVQTVNYIDIGLVALMLMFAISGYFRGLAINIVNFIRLSVGAFLCFYLSQNAAEPLYRAYVRDLALKKINRDIVVSNNIDTVIKNLNDVIGSIPSFISSKMDIKTVDITSTDLAKSILDGVFEPVLILLMKAAIFILVFILFFGASGIIIHIIKKNSRKKEERNGKRSKLKTTDKILGLLFGLMKGAVFVFAICSILMFILSNRDNMTGAEQFVKQIDESVCLDYINRINPFNAITEGII